MATADESKLFKLAENADKLIYPVFGSIPLNPDHFYLPPVHKKEEWTSCVYTDETTEIDHTTNSPSHSFVEISRTEDLCNEDPCVLDDYDECLDAKDIPDTAVAHVTTENESISSVKAVTTAAVSAVSILAATALSIKYGPTITRAIRAGVTGVHEHFKKQNPASFQTYHPFEYVVPFLSAAFNTTVLDVVNQVQGHQDDRDIEEILNAVEDRISAAKTATRELRGGWSEDQIVVAEAWLDEAKKRYKDFVKKHSMGVQISPTNIIPKQVTDALSSSKPSNTTAEATSAEIAPPPAASPSPVNARVTVGDVMDATRKARELRNPSKEQLAQEDGLEDLITALEGLLDVPYLLPSITEEMVRANIKKNPALGCRTFIDNVAARALMIVGNLSKAAKDRNKKVSVAASGPGTGKSVTIAQGIGWTGLPMTTLVGSALAGLQIPCGQTAFELFAEAVRNAVCGFRVNGVRVACGFIYGDDFDRAWNRNGIFSMSSGCRSRFFSFCKEAGDPSIATIFKSEPHLFSYSLVKDRWVKNSLGEEKLITGRYFPFNWSHIHFGVSCNTMPPEFLPGTADPAMIDRLGNLGADYANASDRLSAAFDNRLPSMLQKVREWYKVRGEEESEKQVQLINMDTARFALATVVQTDVDIVCDTFEGRLGIRGLCNMLDTYEQAIIGRLPTDRAPVDPDLFAFKDWHIKNAIKSTDAYTNRPIQTWFKSNQRLLFPNKFRNSEPLYVRFLPKCKTVFYRSWIK